MEKMDFERLQNLCKDHGFSIESYLGGKTAIIGVKDIWDGVEFAECTSNQAKDEYTLGKIYLIIEKDIEFIRTLNDDKGSLENGWNKSNFKPSTESAYIDQLKSECFKRFGEIKEGDKMFTKFDGETFIIDSGRGFNYIKGNDLLMFNGWSIYQKGQWATRVKERVKVEFNNFEYETGEFPTVSFCFGMKPIGDIVGIGKFLALKLEEYLNR